MSNHEFDDFKKTWESQIEIIRKEAIDGDGIYKIRLQFDLCRLKLEMANEPIVNKSYSDQDLDLIESQLNVALEIAHSRFRLRNRGVLAKLFGRAIDKIPTK
jgi:hypothetical protein